MSEIFSKKRLIDYFMILEPQVELSELNINFATLQTDKKLLEEGLSVSLLKNVISKIPLENYSDYSFEPQEIINYFPQEKIFFSKQINNFFTLWFINTYGHHYYCSVLKVYEPLSNNLIGTNGYNYNGDKGTNLIHSPSHQIVNNFHMDSGSLGSPKKGGVTRINTYFPNSKGEKELVQTQVSNKGKEIYVPKFLCFVSQNPFFISFKYLLEEMYHNSTINELRCYKIENIINYLMFRIYLPKSFSTQVSFALGTRNYVFSSNTLKHEFSIRLLFALFKVEDVVKLFLATLMDSKIIMIHDSRIDLLAPIISCLMNLIFPLNFGYKIIINLFPNMIDYIDTPTPTFFGVDKSNFNRESYDYLFLTIDRVKSNKDSSNLVLVYITDEDCVVKTDFHYKMDKDFIPIKKIKDLITSVETLFKKYDLMEVRSKIYSLIFDKSNFNNYIWENFMNKNINHSDIIENAISKFKVNLIKKDTKSGGNFLKIGAQGNNQSKFNELVESELKAEFLFFVLSIFAYYDEEKHYEYDKETNDVHFKYDEFLEDTKDDELKAFIETIRENEGFDLFIQNLNYVVDKKYKETLRDLGILKAEELKDNSSIKLESLVKSFEYIEYPVFIQGICIINFFSFSFFSKINTNQVNYNVNSLQGNNELKNNLNPLSPKVLTKEPVNIIPNYIKGQLGDKVANRSNISDNTSNNNINQSSTNKKPEDSINMALYLNHVNSSQVNSIVKQLEKLLDIYTSDIITNTISIGNIPYEKLPYKQASIFKDVLHNSAIKHTKSIDPSRIIIDHSLINFKYNYIERLNETNTYINFLEVVENNNGIQIKDLYLANQKSKVKDKNKLVITDNNKHSSNNIKNSPKQLYKLNATKHYNNNNNNHFKVKSNDEVDNNILTSNRTNMIEDNESNFKLKNNEKKVKNNNKNNEFLNKEIFLDEKINNISEEGSNLQFGTLNSLSKHSKFESERVQNERQNNMGITNKNEKHKHKKLNVSKQLINSNNYSNINFSKQQLSKNNTGLSNLNNALHKHKLSVNSPFKLSEAELNSELSKHALSSSTNNRLIQGKIFDFFKFYLKQDYKDIIFKFFGVKSNNLLQESWNKSISIWEKKFGYNNKKSYLKGIGGENNSESSDSNHSKDKKKKRNEKKEDEGKSIKPNMNINVVGEVKTTKKEKPSKEKYIEFFEQYYQQYLQESSPAIEFHICYSINIIQTVSFCEYSSCRRPNTIWDIRKDLTFDKESKTNCKFCGRVYSPTFIIAEYKTEEDPMNLKRNIYSFAEKNTKLSKKDNNLNNVNLNKTVDSIKNIISNNPNNNGNSNANNLNSNSDITGSAINLAINNSNNNNQNNKEFNVQQSVDKSNFKLITTNNPFLSTALAKGHRIKKVKYLPLDYICGAVFIDSAEGDLRSENVSVLKRQQQPVFLNVLNLFYELKLRLKNISINEISNVVNKKSSANLFNSTNKIVKVERKLSITQDPQVKDSLESVKIYNLEEYMSKVLGSKESTNPYLKNSKIANKEELDLACTPPKKSNNNNFFLFNFNNPSGLSSNAGFNNRLSSYNQQLGVSSLNNNGNFFAFQNNPTKTLNNILKETSTHEVESQKKQVVDKLIECVKTHSKLKTISNQTIKSDENIHSNRKNQEILNKTISPALILKIPLNKFTDKDQFEKFSKEVKRNMCGHSKDKIQEYLGQVRLIKEVAINNTNDLNTYKYEKEFTQSTSKNNMKVKINESANRTLILKSPSDKISPIKKTCFKGLTEKDRHSYYNEKHSGKTFYNSMLKNLVKGSSIQFIQEEENTPKTASPQTSSIRKESQYTKGEGLKYHDSSKQVVFSGNTQRSRKSSNKKKVKLNSICVSKKSESDGKCAFPKHKSTTSNFISLVNKSIKTVKTSLCNKKSTLKNGGILTNSPSIGRENYFSESNKSDELTKKCSRKSNVIKSSEPNYKFINKAIVNKYNNYELIAINKNNKELAEIPYHKLENIIVNNSSNNRIPSSFNNQDNHNNRNLYRTLKTHVSPNKEYVYNRSLQDYLLEIEEKGSKYTKSKLKLKKRFKSKEKINKADAESNNLNIISNNNSLTSLSKSNSLSLLKCKKLNNPDLIFLNPNYKSVLEDEQKRNTTPNYKINKPKKDDSKKETLLNKLLIFEDSFERRVYEKLVQRRDRLKQLEQQKRINKANLEQQTKVEKALAREIKSPFLKEINQIFYSKEGTLRKDVNSNILNSPTLLNFREREKSRNKSKKRTKKGHRNLVSNVSGIMSEQENRLSRQTSNYSSVNFQHYNVGNNKNYKRSVTTMDNNHNHYQDFNGNYFKNN